MTKKKSAADIEWAQRTLCSDESCIGVIGPDGRCMECGLRYKGKLPETFYEASDASAVPEESDSAHDEGAPAPPTQAPQASQGPAPQNSEDEWDQRTLCSDESCIGVIGSDGRCMECGKPYKG